MTDARRPVAFLGLGRMGLPMSINVARAGFAVRAWNRSERSVTGTENLDYTRAATPSAAARDAEVIITMLPDLDQVIDVCERADGALAGARPGAVVIIMGTVSSVAVREWSKQVQQRGFALIDAPVSGGVTGARDASLSIMVGGASDIVARIRPLLDAMGTVVRHLGDIGAGQLAKACNQIVVAGTLTALGEAITLARHGGLDIDLLLDILSGGLAGSRVLDVKRTELTSRTFTPGGSASFQHKDLGFALQAARAHGVAMPVAALVDQLYGAMRWTGHGNDDHSGIVQITERLSHVEPA